MSDFGVDSPFNIAALGYTLAFSLQEKNEIRTVKMLTTPGSLVIGMVYNR